MKEKKINKISTSELPKERDFFKDVYDVVRQIPKGRVTSYGAIAKYLSTKSGARMVFLLHFYFVLRFKTYF